jgi:WD40 repeat protein
MDGTVPYSLQPTGRLDGSGTYSPDGQIVAWCPRADSTLLAVAGKGTVVVCDVMSGRPYLMHSLHRGDVRSLAWSPDGKSIATGGDDSTVRLWEPASGHLLWVHDVVPSQGASLAVLETRHRGTTRQRIEDIDDLRPAQSSNAVCVIAWSPDGGHIATSTGDEKKIHVLQAGTGLEEVAWESGAKVEALAWMPDGRLLISASRDHALQVWDAATSELVRDIEGPEPRRGVMALSPDGSRLAWGTDDGKVQMGQWRGQGESMVLETLFALRLSASSYPVNAMAWSPDGRVIASASGNTVRLWNARTAEVLDRVSVDGTVLSVAFSSDGLRLAAGSINGHAELWRIEGNDAAPGGEEEWGEVLDLHPGDLVVRNRRPYLANTRDSKIRDFNDIMGVSYRVEGVGEVAVELVGLEGTRHHMVPRDLMVTTHWHQMNTSSLDEKEKE